MADFNDGFSKTRIRIGHETDSFENLSSFGSSTALSDLNALHMSLEHVDPSSGMRFARTYFLNSLDENENDSKTLLWCYLSLIKASNVTAAKFMAGKASQ
jgi:hypothetical protein